MFRDLHREKGSQISGALLGSSCQLPLKFGGRNPAFGVTGKGKGGSQFYLFTQEMFREHNYMPGTVLGVGDTEDNDSKSLLLYQRGETKTKPKTTPPHPMKKVKKKKEKEMHN